MFTWADASLVGTGILSTWTIAWFLSAKINGTNSLVYRKFDELKNVFLEKLEYHERHDDSRFEAIRKDFWEMRVSNAARSGRVNGKTQEDHS